MTYTHFCYWLCGLFDNGDFCESSFEKIQYEISKTTFDSHKDHKSKKFVDGLKGLFIYVDTYDLFKPHLCYVRKNLINVINDINSVSEVVNNVLTRPVYENHQDLK
ncbi:MAG: hypothetical protein KDH96_06315 [Candidatus Riesia sp.]|nr:hypothetical protein [Candidatus Riesia sp.]